MVPQHRNRRLGLIAICALALGLGIWLLGNALRSNTQFFYDPSEVAAPDFISATQTVRIGGLVVPGSVIKGEAAGTGGISTQFQLSDFEGDAPGLVSVTFDGALPDLFREGQGIVVVGTPMGAGRVRATEVLAKHDENYRPAT